MKKTDLETGLEYNKINESEKKSEEKSDIKEIEEEIEEEKDKKEEKKEIEEKAKSNLLRKNSFMVKFEKDENVYDYIRDEININQVISLIYIN